jgi:hypothetical protein
VILVDGKVEEGSLAVILGEKTYKMSREWDFGFFRAEEFELFIGSDMARSLHEGGGVGEDGCALLFSMY